MVGITLNGSNGTGIAADAQACISGGVLQADMTSCSAGNGADVATNGAVYALNQIGISNSYVFSSIDTLNLFNLW